MTIELCAGFCGINLPQQNLILRPGQIKYTVGNAAIPVFLNQGERRGPAFTDAEDHIDRDRLSRLQCNAGSDGHHGIKDRTLASRKCFKAISGRVHRLGMIDGIPASDELHSVGFIGNLSGLRSMHGHQVKHPGIFLFLGTWPAGAKNSPALFKNFGLNKEIAEGRMDIVCGGLSQNHFRVTRDVESSLQSGVVDDDRAADLNIIFR